MRVDTEEAAVVEVVVVEEATTENADHHHTTKTDHVMIGHVHVLILHVSLKEFLIKTSILVPYPAIQCFLSLFY